MILQLNESTKSLHLKTNTFFGLITGAINQQELSINFLLDRLIYSALNKHITNV